MFKSHNKLFTKALIGISTSFTIVNCDYDRNSYDKNIGKVFTKKDFFQSYPNFKPLKIIRSDMKHHDYTYTFGLNTIDNFKPQGQCSDGGFYLSDNSNIIYFLSWGDNVAYITLPDDCLIYLENDKIKVNKLMIDKIISKKEYFSNLSEEEMYKIVEYDYSVIQYITNPSVQLKAVKQNGLAIQYIKNPTEEMKLEAVKQNGLAIKYINNPTEEMKLEAVKQNGLAILYIKNPNLHILLRSIKHKLLTIFN